MLHLEVGYSKIEICGRQYYMVHIRSNKALCWILSCSFLSSPVLVWSSAGVAHADVLVACLAVLCCWYWNVVHSLIGAFGWIRAHRRFLHTPASILFLQRRIKSSNANVPVQLAVIAITEPRPYLTDLSSLSNIFFFLPTRSGKLPSDVFLTHLLSFTFSLSGSTLSALRHVCALLCAQKCTSHENIL